MKHVSCNLCGADEPVVVFPKGYAQMHRIVRCPRCGLMYADPQERIDCEVLARPFGPVYDPERPEDRQYYQKRKAQVPDNLCVLRELDKLFPARGRLLEIGCFAGIFLGDRIRADGWQATGLEPSKPLVEYARVKYGLNIINGVLPNPALPEGQFDAVVMLHVIEHMPDPARDVREIRRLLKPGGVLAAETPRFNSQLFKLLGHRERSIQNCNGHIYFFTEQTLSQLLERSGFEPFKIQKVGRTLTLERFIYNVGLVTHSDRLERWSSQAASALHLDQVRIHVNVRDMQRIYARAV